VLDAVVDHLDEVAGAVRSPVEIPPLGGAADPLPTTRAGAFAGGGGPRRADRIEVLDHSGLAADHQAIPAVASPDAAAGPDVHVVDALACERLRAADVIDVIRIAALDQDVPWSEMRQE